MNRWHLLHCGWHRVWDDSPNNVPLTRRMLKDSIKFHETLPLVAQLLLDNLRHLLNCVLQLSCKMQEAATDLFDCESGSATTSMSKDFVTRSIFYFVSVKWKVP